MRTLALVPVLAAGFLFLTASPAQARDPLLCIDPGPTHIGPYVVDIPEVCIL